MAPTGAPRSRHILIYGPPAAGKLTVAQSLVARCGFRLLDNHTSIDPALRLFAFGTREFAGLVEKLRVDLLGAAARAGLDVVSTLVFADPIDRDHVARLVDASQSEGAAVTLVQLRPARGVLEQRVLEPSRANSHKIRDPARLRRMLDQYGLMTPIDESGVSIDNSHITAREVAQLIAHAVGLDRQRPATCSEPPSS